MKETSTVCEYSTWRQHMLAFIWLRLIRNWIEKLETFVFSNYQEIGAFTRQRSKPAYSLTDLSVPLEVSINISCYQKILFSISGQKSNNDHKVNENRFLKSELVEVFFCLYYLCHVNEHNCNCGSSSSNSMTAAFKWHLKDIFTNQSWKFKSCLIHPVLCPVLGPLLQGQRCWSVSREIM